MQTYWPGKLTLILPCDGHLATVIGRPSDGAVGVRLPDNDWLLQLLDRFQSPLVGTSANSSGRPPARTASEVRDYFGSAITWLGTSDAVGGQPSTVVDVTGDRPAIVRQGAIPATEILQHHVSGSVT
jgi:tRNA threonylcarbamoyl adenosine modification protein (Sua5/YciO/YrdC/YwlC family)